MTAVAHPPDLTVYAIPAFAVAMAAEALISHRRGRRIDGRDYGASLLVGLGSLVTINLAMAAVGWLLATWLWGHRLVDLGTGPAGWLVALAYAWGRRQSLTGTTFPGTLVLMTILIAMVTQVIGDNAARAFGLVGALSIVRFRTVMQDTQDVAYVIFAVAVGMAIGAGQPVVALMCWIGIALAATAFRHFPSVNVTTDVATLHVRLGLGRTPDLLKGLFDQQERQRLAEFEGALASLERQLQAVQALAATN